MVQVIPMRDYFARCEALAKKTWQLTYKQTLRRIWLCVNSWITTVSRVYSSL